MSRGHPDYQAFREPAIALQTVWSDDFEAPDLTWGVDSSAGSNDPILDTTRAWKGVQSVFFFIVAAADEYSEMIKQFPVLSRGRIGVEFFIFPLPVFEAYMRVRVYICDGTNISQAELRLDFTARTAVIVTPAGNIPIATFVFNTVADQVWTPFKLVIDMNTDRYVRLFSSPTEIDLSAHALVLGGATTNKMITVEFRLLSAGDFASSANIDEFILTQNEP